MTFMKTSLTQKSDRQPEVVKCANERLWTNHRVDGLFNVIAADINEYSGAFEFILYTEQIQTRREEWHVLNKPPVNPPVERHRGSSWPPKPHVRAHPPPAVSRSPIVTGQVP